VWRATLPELKETRALRNVQHSTGATPLRDSLWPRTPCLHKQMSMIKSYTERRAVGRCPGHLHVSDLLNDVFISPLASRHNIRNACAAHTTPMQSQAHEIPPTCGLAIVADTLPDSAGPSTWSGRGALPPPVGYPWFF